MKQHEPLGRCLPHALGSIPRKGFHLDCRHCQSLVQFRAGGVSPLPLFYALGADVGSGRGVGKIARVVSEVVWVGARTPVKG